MCACCAIANVLAHAPVIDEVVVISTGSSTGELPVSTALLLCACAVKFFQYEECSKSSPVQSNPESTVHILQVPNFFM